MDIAEAPIGFEFRGANPYQLKYLVTFCHVHSPNDQVWLQKVGKGGANQGSAPPPANGPSAYAWSLWFNRYMVVVCTYLFESQYSFSVLV